MLTKIKGKILFNEPLFKHTTFRIGGPCKIWIEPQSECELRKILKFAKSKKKKIFVIGMGSNVLPRDRGFDGIVIHLGGRHFKGVHFRGLKVTAGAGVMLAYLVNLTCKKGLKGIEGLVGIPGTLGGAIFMNSGYVGKISDCLEEIKVMDKDSGNTRTIRKKNLKFGYRQSSLDRYIILEVTLRLRRANKKLLLKRKKELLKIKKDEQPLWGFNAGCIFRNPKGKISAAQYIDMSGFKGKTIHGAKVSPRHANFIINSKNAKATDVLRLMELIKKRVKSHFNVDLTTEIKVL